VIYFIWETSVNTTMEKYKIKYALIALLSLLPVVYRHFYQLPGHGNGAVAGVLSWGAGDSNGGVGRLAGLPDGCLFG
jgi:hypothetical protein